MPSLSAKCAALATQLAALPGDSARLAFLVERARQSPAFEPERRTPQHLVEGCLAKLWLIAEVRHQRCFFSCDSDSLVVKAVALALCELYSDASPEEILAADANPLLPLGLTQHLTPHRRNALSHVLSRIRLAAATAAQPTAPLAPLPPDTNA